MVRHLRATYVILPLILILICHKLNSKLNLAVSSPPIHRAPRKVPYRKPPPQPKLTKYLPITEFPTCAQSLSHLNAVFRRSRLGMIRLPGSVPCNTTALSYYHNNLRSSWDLKYNKGTDTDSEFDLDVKMMFKHTAYAMRDGGAMCPKPLVEAAQELYDRRDIRFKFNTVQWSHDAAYSVGGGSMRVEFGHRLYQNATVATNVDMVLALKPDPEEKPLYPNTGSTSSVIDMVFSGYIRRPGFYNIWPKTRKNFIDPLSPRHIHIM
eukprot:PhF_6_TR40778/c0_g1_i1/m.61537